MSNVTHLPTPAPREREQHPAGGGLLPFVEAFGNTIQGEGPASGRVADFLRFGGCNLSCSWCDSAYTWNSEEYNLREQITLLDVDGLMERLPPNPAPIMVVTGGEPLLNQRKAAFLEVLELLRVRGQQVHVETNGTILPTQAVAELVDLFIVSPKLPHAGLHKRSQDPSLVQGWMERAPGAHMKVVVRNAEDVQLTAGTAVRYGWPLEQTWVMPEGVTSEVLNARWPEVATAAAQWGVNACHRLHVLAWNDVRGH